MTELRCGNDRLWTAWTAEENQKQVSPFPPLIPLSQHQERKEITLACTLTVQAHC